MTDTNDQKNDDTIRQTVLEGYRNIATTGTACCGSEPSIGTGGGCCGTSSGASLTAEQLAEQIGYDAEQLRALPEGANMGLSCGNPIAIGQLRRGETVVDLGSGGGFDIFLAGPKVGPTGRAIGVDMTTEMLAKARGNVDHYRRTTGLDNVEFRLGEIEHLPLADASVDVVISNCVINLSPDKPQVWSEIARVLKPGGRVAASDMALLQPLPEQVREMAEAMIGCVAGAVMVDDYNAMIRDAGLERIELTPKPQYIAALRDFKDPLYGRICEALPDGRSLEQYITSLDVVAYKTTARACCA
jgi:ubiquinone/menaquinone biosynthesis C-methylase UbiE